MIHLNGRFVRRLLLPVFLLALTSPVSYADTWFWFRAQDVANTFTTANPTYDCGSDVLANCAIYGIVLQPTNYPSYMPVDAVSPIPSGQSAWTGSVWEWNYDPNQEPDVDQTLYVDFEDLHTNTWTCLGIDCVSTYVGDYGSLSMITHGTPAGDFWIEAPFGPDEMAVEPMDLNTVFKFSLTSPPVESVEMRAKLFYVVLDANGNQVQNPKLTHETDWIPFDVEQIPEPASASLALIALVGALLARRLRRQN